MNKKQIMVGIVMMLCLVAAVGQTAGQYIKSTQAVSSGKEDLDLSKAEWTVRLKDRQLTINSRGKAVVDGKQLTFAVDGTQNDYISGIEYILFDTWVLMQIAFENSDATCVAYFRLDARAATQPAFLAYSSGMSVNQFLSDGKTIFEATQFSFRLYGIDAKKDIWINSESIGTDYHYKNIVTYLGNNVVRIEFMHTVDGAQKFESIRLSLKDGKLIAK